MTSKTPDFFYGWDLLYKTIEKMVNKHDDLLIALAHFILTKHSQFKCIGIGDDKTLPDDDEERGSELLPDNWNDDDYNYALRYTNNKMLYILLGLRTEGALIITLLDVKSRKVSNIGLDAQELVKGTHGSITKMIPTVSQLVDRYRRELLEPVFSGNSKTVTTQTTGTSPSNNSQGPDSLRIGEPRLPPFGVYHPAAGPNPPPPPPPFGFPVGRGDLDPLGRGGPGNLFPFPSQPEFRLGPDNSGIGGVPRPRFDPYGPPERNIPPNPNPDHMAPPNFGGHDYYM